MAEMFMRGDRPPKDSPLWAQLQFGNPGLHGQASNETVPLNATLQDESEEDSSQSLISEVCFES